MNQARATDKSMNISNAIYTDVQTFTNLVSGQVVPHTKFLLHDKKLEKVKDPIEKNINHTYADSEATACSGPLQAL